jgi:hypothetical protein
VSYHRHNNIPCPILKNCHRFEPTSLGMFSADIVIWYDGSALSHPVIAIFSVENCVYHVIMPILIIIPPLWSSGQSSWLQIHRLRFDSWPYQIFWKVVGLERGPLSLVSTVEELLEISSGSGLETRDYGHRGSTVLTTRHPFIHKSWV